MQFPRLSGNSERLLIGGPIDGIWDASSMTQLSHILFVLMGIRSGKGGHEMTYVRPVSIALIISVGMAISACGPTHSSISAASMGLKIPTEFWNSVDPAIRLTAFPRTSGENRCKIPEDGPQRPGAALIAGSCTTRIQRPPRADSQCTDFRAVSSHGHGHSVRAVGRWGAGTSATFTFIINRRGKVLTDHVTGQPPQLWK